MSVPVPVHLMDHNARQLCLCLTGGVMRHKSRQRDWSGRPLFFGAPQ